MRKGKQAGMEFNHANFAQVLEELKDTARLQGNMLTSGQLDEAFAQWQLGEEQLELVQDYFRSHHIGIDEPKDTAEHLSGDDVNFLEMYLKELEALPPVSDGEKRAVMMTGGACGGPHRRGQCRGSFGGDDAGLCGRA